MMIKKTILFLMVSTTLFCIFVFFSGTENQSFTTKLKNTLPRAVKSAFRDYVYVFHDLEELKKKYAIQQSHLQSVTRDRDQKERLFSSTLREIPFTKTVENKKFTIADQTLSLKQFETDFLFISKNTAASSTVYLEHSEETLFLISASGQISHVGIESLSNDSFNAQIIPTNLDKLITFDEFYTDSQYGIRDALIDKGKLYISYSGPASPDCYTTSIAVAELDKTALAFENFYAPLECVQSQNSYGEYSADEAGGRMVSYKDNQILFSTGTFRFRDHAQNPQSIFGKILAIDTRTGDTRMVSMGFRNPHGLFYDRNRDAVFSTDHGANGGDEVNINTTPDDEIKNFGWPISSYGDHYGFAVRDDHHPRYIKAPLHQSHSDYGFLEPLTYFSPSIGVEELVVIGDDLYVSSLGHDLTEGDLSLHHFNLGDQNQPGQHTVLPLEHRIRDMIYLPDINSLILYFEDINGLAILSLPMAG